ncbi:hypothetical protein MKEN_00000600 [Mycena kentingensis (nom. inval.)]|nr:hypothetical protein MKEN_00000600 [Mycena kentingensis (nom. inval.)]
MALQPIVERYGTDIGAGSPLQKFAGGPHAFAIQNIYSSTEPKNQVRLQHLNNAFTIHASVVQQEPSTERLTYLRPFKAKRKHHLLRLPILLDVHKFPPQLSVREVLDRHLPPPSTHRMSESTSTALILRSAQVLALSQSRVSLLPGPGRTLHELYNALGARAETTANRAAHTFGLGPLAVAGRISGFFDADGIGLREERMTAVRSGAKRVGKLKRDCSKLVYYTLPSHAIATQIDALACIVDFSTRYPSLRHLFLEARIVQRRLRKPVSADGLRALWARGSSDAELGFFVDLAAACLVDSDIATLVERSPVENVRVAGCSGRLSVVESLLVSADYSPIALRYLGGILELPSFWAQAGSIFDDVLRKLADAASRLLRDLDVEQAATGTPTESISSDIDGADIFCTALLAGIHDIVVQSRAGMELEEERWYGAMAAVVRLLRYPRAETVVPTAYLWATSPRFERWFPTSYRLRSFTTAMPVTVHGYATGAMERASVPLASDQPPIPGEDAWLLPGPLYPRRSDLPALENAPKGRRRTRMAGVVAFMRSLSFFARRSSRAGRGREIEDARGAESLREHISDASVEDAREDTGEPPDALGGAEPTVPSTSAPPPSPPREPTPSAVTTLAHPLSADSANPVGRFHEVVSRASPRADDWLGVLGADGPRRDGDGQYVDGERLAGWRRCRDGGRAVEEGGEEGGCGEGVGGYGRSG